MTYDLRYRNHHRPSTGLTLRYVFHLWLALAVVVFVAGGCASSAGVARGGESIFDGKPALASEYDAFEDKTTYTARPLRVAGDSGAWAGVHLEASAMCQGRSLCEADSVMVSVISTSDDWRYLRQRRVQFIADGRRMELARMGRVGETLAGGRVAEVLVTTIPARRFQTLAAADSLRGRTARQEFSLSRRARAPWRALLSKKEAAAMMQERDS